MIKAIVNGAAPVTVESSGKNFLVNGKELITDLQLLKEGTYHLLLNQRSYTIEVIASDRNEKKHLIRINGKNFDVQLRDRYDELLHELGMDAVATQKIADLKAPMPGLVVAISVEEGQQVKKGDTLVILEAMKMENSLKAVADATVKKISVNKGQAVEKNEILIHLG